MMHWSKKPLRPATTDSLFEFNSEETYVVKAQSDIEAQRARDGSPHTALRPSALGPPPATELYLSSDKLDKAQVPEASGVVINPDEVVKSYMAYKDREDEEKGGGAIASAATGAAKAAGNAVVNTVRMAHSAK